MSTPKRENLLTETLPIDAVKQLLGNKSGKPSASELRDRLIEVAGNRPKLVQLMDAVAKLP